VIAFASFTVLRLPSIFHLAGCMPRRHAAGFLRFWQVSADFFFEMLTVERQIAVSNARANAICSNSKSELPFWHELLSALPDNHGEDPSDNRQSRINGEGSARLVR
jgi:hypothetical protein